MLQHQTKESCPVLCATTKNSVLEEKLIGCYLVQLCCFHLFFLLSPTINTSPPSPQLLSYPKHVVLASVIQGWVKNLLLLQGLGKAEQTWLCSHLRGTNEDIQVSLKAKSRPSTRAIPMGTRDAVAVPKLPVPCCGLSGDIPALTPLSHPSGCHDKAVLLYEYVGKRIVDLQHTEVPDAYRGRGIAKHLAKVRPQAPRRARAVAIPAVARDPG